MSFDVKLPNGKWMRGIPEGTSKADIQARAVSVGMAADTDFAPTAAPQPNQAGAMAAPNAQAAAPQAPKQPQQPRNNTLVPYADPDSEIPSMIPQYMAEAKQAEDAELNKILDVPDANGDQPLYKQVTKGTRIAVSAMAGAEMGRRLAGPDPRMQIAGAAGGGALGAAFASFSDDIASSVPAHEAALNALKEGTLDLTLGAGIPILANYAKVLGPAFMKVAGIDAEKIA